MTALASGSIPNLHTGLSSAEVELSRAKHGANVLTPPDHDSWWKLYFQKFDDPVIRILMIAAIIAIGVGVADGSYAEGIGILLAIFLSTGLAFLNEFKANKEFDILNKTSDDVPVTTMRDGTFAHVPRRDLVVGDVIRIEVGEEVPADAEVVQAVALFVNEGILTGESEPVSKTSNADPVAVNGTAYAENRVLRGTKVVDGYGLMVITAVGDATELGQTARAASEEVNDESPLHHQLERLSKLIGVVGLAVAGITLAALVVLGVVRGELSLTTPQWNFMVLVSVALAVALMRVWLPILLDGLELLGAKVVVPGWLEDNSLRGWLRSIGIGVGLFVAGLGTGYLGRFIPDAPADWLPPAAGQEFLSYFMIAVTIIVVAVPEGLAMSVTLSLAYSMRKMTASNSLVRRMHACETIGAATVICSDKTGTLTLNEMRVIEVGFPGLEGPVQGHDRAVALPPLVIEAICANTTAHLSRKPEEGVKPLGNPTEGALLLWLDSHGIDYIEPRRRFGLTVQWTFTTERKFMGTLGTSTTLSGDILHVKGAPEVVLARCTEVATVEGVRPIGDQRVQIESLLKSFQSRGMRTLAFAYQQGPVSTERANLEDLAVRMTWLGFVAIADPIRADVPAAIQACHEAGVQVKMLTGDSPDTAKEIARQIGLWNEQETVKAHWSAEEFGRLNDTEARSAVMELKVMSRARPSDKLRLVSLLQAHDQVVAVTGDGVNDGPALNHANVGLAMGKTGTAVAKEASDIILLDDSFRTIVLAIMWGRSLYENIQRFILFQLTINVAALGLALLGPFVGFKLPLTVMQMLWVNLIMDTFAALALATEPPHWNVMKRPPRNPRDFIVTPAMARIIFFTAGLFLVALISLVFVLRSHGLLDDEDAPSRGGTILFTVFVLLQFWNLFNARCLGTIRSCLAGIRHNMAFVAIAVAILSGQFLIVQFGGRAFRTVPISMTDWVSCLGGTSIVLWVGELERWLRRWRKGNVLE